MHDANPCIHHQTICVASRWKNVVFHPDELQVLYSLIQYCMYIIQDVTWMDLLFYKPSQRSLVYVSESISYVLRIDVHILYKLYVKNSWCTTNPALHYMIHFLKLVISFTPRYFRKHEANLNALVHIYIILIHEFYSW